MIKIINFRKIDTDIEVSFTPQTKTYNIVTGFMSDDCRPFRAAQSAMIWMSESGEIGEIECIYPFVVEEEMCPLNETIKQFTGLPTFEIICCNNEACIQNQDNGFIIWLNKDKEIDTEIIFKQLSFLVSENELVGIVCREYLVIE